MATLEDVIVVTSFPDRASVWILAFVYNQATGALVDPTAVKIIIIDPDGTVQIPSEGNGDDDMTKYETETGIYEYFYHKGATADPMDEGEWRIEGSVIDGVLDDAIISPFHGSFTVK